MKNPATLGHKLVQLFAYGAFAAETDAALVPLSEQLGHSPAQPAENGGGEDQSECPQNGMVLGFCPGIGQVTDQKGCRKAHQPDTQFANLVIQPRHFPAAAFTGRTEKLFTDRNLDTPGMLHPAPKLKNKREDPGRHKSQDDVHDGAGHEYNKSERARNVPIRNCDYAWFLIFGVVVAILGGLRHD